MSLYEDSIQLPNGYKTKYGYLKRKDGALALIVNTQNQVLLIEQYQYPIKRFQFGLPRGVCDKLITPVPEDERSDIVNAYFKRFQNPERYDILPFVRGWASYEGHFLKLIDDMKFQTKFTSKEQNSIIQSGKIFLHYEINNGFLQENELLQNIDKIEHIPAVIVNGRYDMVTPMITAWELHKAWPEADFHIIPDAGHHSSEKGIQQMLLRYIEKLSKHP